MSRQYNEYVNRRRWTEEAKIKKEILECYAEAYDDFVEQTKSYKRKLENPIYPDRERISDDLAYISNIIRKMLYEDDFIENAEDYPYQVCSYEFRNYLKYRLIDETLEYVSNLFNDEV